METEQSKQTFCAFDVTGVHLRLYESKNYVKGKIRFHDEAFTKDFDITLYIKLVI